MGNVENGKKICGIIAVYMVAKQLLNLIIGFSLQNIIWLLIAGGLGYVLIKGLNVFNVVNANILTAIVLIILCLIHIKGNIQGKQWLYLLEGILDLVSSYFLLANKDVKAYFE